MKVNYKKIKKIILELIIVLLIGYGGIFILYGIAKGFEKIEWENIGKPYQFKYDGEYIDNEDSVLFLNYIEKVDGFKVSLRIDNNDVFNEIIFIQENKYLYKSSLNSIDLHLQLDKKKGKEVILLDGIEMITFIKE